MSVSLCDSCRYCWWRASAGLYGWWDEICVHPQRQADWPVAGEATRCAGYLMEPPLTKFETALAHVFDIEAGYAKRLHDRGGPTLFGITQTTYDAWRRAKQLPPQLVSRMERAEAKAIYQEWYWDAAACELLPAALSICAFDAMVNHPPKIAIGFMQRALGLVADGVIGPVTQAAYRAAVDSPQVIWKFVAARLDFYADIVFDDPEQRGFLKGWLRRAHVLERLLLPER